MPTITAGSVATVYCPLAGSITVTPGSAGRVSFQARAANGGQSAAPRELYAAESITVAAGDTVTLEAINTDATYTTPAGGDSAVSSLVSGAWNPAAQQPAASFGDSYEANGVSLTAPNRILTERNLPAFLGQMLGAPWVWQYSDGVSGSTTIPFSGSTAGADWIARLPSLVAAVQANGIRHVFIGFPTNDARRGITAAQSMAALIQIYDALKPYALVHQVLGGVNGESSPPVGTTANVRAIYLQLLARMRDYCNANNVYTIDAHSVWIDPATQGWASGMSYDNTVHPSGKGCAAGASFNVEQYRRAGFGRAVVTPSALNGLAYNPAMAGVSSGYALGWSQYTAGAPTGTTGTKVARTDGRSGEWQRVTATATAVQDRWGVQQTINLNTAWASIAATPALGVRVLGSYGDHWVCTVSGAKSGAQPAALAAASNIGDVAVDGSATWTRVANILPGTVCEFAVEMAISGVSGGDLGCRPEVIVNYVNGSPFSAQRVNGTANETVMPVWPAGSCVLSFERFAVPAGTTSIQLFAYCRASNGVTASVDVGSFDFRPVSG